jgi:hypothetical protein
MNLTKGFLATTWHKLASTYFSNPEDPITQRDNGSHRIANAIRALQKFTHSIWLGRNERSSPTKRDTHSPPADSHRHRDRTTSCRQLRPRRCRQTLLRDSTGKLTHAGPHHINDGGFIGLEERRSCFSRPEKIIKPDLHRTSSDLTTPSISPRTTQ